MARYTNPHLLDGEQIVESRRVTKDDGADFDVLTVVSPTTEPGDLVFIDIATHTGADVLIGGNPLEIKVLRGIGTLTLTDLIDGMSWNVNLIPQTEVNIPANNFMYRMTNDGEGSLLVRDYCPGFDESHEPSPQDVVSAMTRMFI